MAHGTEKKIVSTILDGILAAGNGAVSVLSGLLATMLIAYSSYVIYDTVSIQNNATSMWQQLLEYKPEISEDGETPFGASQMSEINPDYRAWLTVYDTSIDYPVVQGPDENYYAMHDIYKKPSLSGAIYLSTANSGDFSDSYSLLYGHHMDNGAMFGSLDRFLDGSYLASHREGIIITESGVYDITFFAVVSTDAYESKIYTVGDRKDDVLSFLGADPNEEGKQPGGGGVGTIVHFYDAVVAASADKILALSTCASVATNGRLVIFGRMTPHVVPEPTPSPTPEPTITPEPTATPEPTITPEPTATPTPAPTVSLTIVKAWEGDKPEDRPAAIYMVLMGGESAQTVTLTAGNNWTATVSGLPAGRDYYWIEPEVSGYTQVSVVTEDGVTVITNRKETPIIPTTRSYGIYMDVGDCFE